MLLANVSVQVARVAGGKLTSGTLERLVASVRQHVCLNSSSGFTSKYMQLDNNKTDGPSAVAYVERK